MSHAIRPNRAQIWLLPPSTDEWVAADHPVRFVAAFVEAVDMARLGFRQSPGDEGRPHYAPELLLGVWLFGWMDRIRSSRGLQKACRRDVAFIWLTGNIPLDHVTLWRFFNANQVALTKLFKELVHVAARAGLVGFALHALDGTKLRAASSMDTALHRKQLELLLKKLDDVVATTVAETKAAEDAPEPSCEMPPGLGTPESLKERIRRALVELKETPSDGSSEPGSSPSNSSTASAEPEQAPGTSEKGESTPELSKHEVVAALDELARHGTQHLHPNEVDARVMRTREGARLAYNAQAVVDHDSDLIVAIDVSGDETDHAQLVPMVEAVRETCGRLPEHVVADAGYCSGAQFEEAQRRHLPVIVDVQEESSMKGPYAKSQFSFDPERNVYICPRGELLPFEMIAKPTTGKPQARHVYRCHNGACPVRAQCTQDKKGRTIKRLDTEDAFARQVAAQNTPAKKILLGLRKEIVEHIFGIAKGCDGFRRFTAFGLTAAKAQWALACLAINLRKLAPAWSNGSLRLVAAG